MTTWKCEDCKSGCPDHTVGRIDQIDSGEYYIKLPNDEVEPLFQPWSQHGIMPKVQMRSPTQNELQQCAECGQTGFRNNRPLPNFSVPPPNADMVFKRESFLTLYKIPFYKNRNRFSKTGPMKRGPVLFVVLQFRHRWPIISCENAPSLCSC